MEQRRFRELTPLTPQEGPARVSGGLLVAWTVAVAVVGLGVWLGYVFSVAGPSLAMSFDCGEIPGGATVQGDGVGIVTALGVGLWLVATLAGSLLGRYLGRMFVGFVVLYVAAVILLAELGPQLHCVPSS